jgi:hypothetical protein
MWRGRAGHHRRVDPDGQYWYSDLARGVVALYLADKGQ